MGLVDIFFYSLEQVFELGYRNAWVASPVILGVIAWKVWVRYINSEFLRKMRWILLEVKLPKEIRRSPLAMELTLAAFHQTGGTSQWYDKYWKGQVRNYFSLEIVSIEGAVHFYIRTQTRFRNGVESYIYAQYPEAEITEVPDYVGRVNYAKNGRWMMWGNEFRHLKPDPYPIKTYVDYGLDRVAKEEEKADPIAPTIELMGSMKKGEQMWFQVIIRATESEWRKVGDAEVAKIKAEKLEETGADKFNEQMLTKGEKDIISAIERNTAKIGFDAGLRVIYIAEKDSFDGANISSAMNMLKQYNTSDLNGFWHKRITALDYPWQNYINIDIPSFSLSWPFLSIAGDVIEKKKVRIFELYKNRSYFYKPYNRVPLVLSAEELATIYHFPGEVSATPSFARVDAKKSEPPVNLPI